MAHAISKRFRSSANSVICCSPSAEKNLAQALLNPSFNVTIVAADVVLLARLMAYQATISAPVATISEADAITSDVPTIISYRLEGLAGELKP